MAHDKTDKLIADLANTATGNFLFNPYNQVGRGYDISTAPGLRQSNLRAYLYGYSRVRPEEMWVTDHIDYNTTLITGIPMIAPEHFLKIQQLLGITEFLENTQKHRDRRVSDTELPDLWSLIGNGHPPAILWSVLPFYPHDGSEEQNLRNIGDQEYLAHSGFFYNILEIFKPKRIFSLDKKTKKNLALINIASVLHVNAV